MVTDILSDIFSNMSTSDKVHLAVDAVSTILDFTGIGTLPAVIIDVAHGISYFVEAFFYENQKEKEDLYLAGYITLGFALLPGLQAAAPVIKTALKGGKVSIKTAKQLKESYILILKNLDLIGSKAGKVAEFLVKKNIITRKHADAFYNGLKESRNLVETKLTKQIDSIEDKTGLTSKVLKSDSEINKFVAQFAKTSPKLDEISKITGQSSQKILKKIQKKINFATKKSGKVDKKKLRQYLRRYFDHLTNKDVVKYFKKSIVDESNKKSISRILKSKNPIEKLGKAKYSDFLEKAKDHKINVFKTNHVDKEFKTVSTTLHNLLKSDGKNTIILNLNKNELRAFGLLIKNQNFFLNSLVDLLTFSYDFPIIGEQTINIVPILPENIQNLLSDKVKTKFKADKKLKIGRKTYNLKKVREQKGWDVYKPIKNDRVVAAVLVKGNKVVFYNKITKRFESIEN